MAGHNYGPEHLHHRENDGRADVAQRAVFFSSGGCGLQFLPNLHSTSMPLYLRYTSRRSHRLRLRPIAYLSRDDVMRSLFEAESPKHDRQMEIDLLDSGSDAGGPAGRVRIHVDL